MKTETFSPDHQLVTHAGSGVEQLLSWEMYQAHMQNLRAHSRFAETKPISPEYSVSRLPRSVEEAQNKIQDLLTRRYLKAQPMHLYSHPIEVACSTPLSLLHTPDVEEGRLAGAVQEIFLAPESFFTIDGHVRIFNALHKASHQFGLVYLGGENWEHVRAHPHSLPRNNKLLLDQLQNSYAFVLSPGEKHSGGCLSSG